VLRERTRGEERSRRRERRSRRRRRRRKVKGRRRETGLLCLKSEKDRAREKKHRNKITTITKTSYSIPILFSLPSLVQRAREEQKKEGEKE